MRSSLDTKNIAAENAKLDSFPYLNSGSQNTTIWVDYEMQVAETPTYPVTCQLPLSLALCDHSPPTLHRDVTKLTIKQRDERHASSISKTWIWHVTLKSGGEGGISPVK